MTRPSKAIIDLAALRANYLWGRSQQHGKAFAVVKANAYGHGAVVCAQSLADIADGFAVAFCAEAVELRAAGITNPILVLEGCFDIEEFHLAQKLSLWVAIHQDSQIRDLEHANLGDDSLHVWLKVDSGMHRAGFALEHVKRAHERLATCSAIASITLMSHFSCSDEPNKSTTLDQIQAFENATQGLPGARSLSNSGAVLAWPQATRDWARLGILLYGADPLPQPAGNLIPVMTLQSTVFAERWLEPGEPIGYGARFVTSAKTRVGLVALGYADGYPRQIPSGTPVAVDGALTTIIGRVSMDMTTIDLTHLPQAGIGSKVEFWGKQIDVNVIAQAAGTISYELLCNVKRVPKEY
ncbi:MAG: alanine racemase [Betaproteobacteria bacterium]